MNDFESKQIREENYHLLKARRILLDTRKGSDLLYQEKNYQSLYESLSDAEVREIAEVDLTLFALTCDPSDFKDIAAPEIYYAEMSVEERILYECNLLILTNRWQRSIAKFPNEILYNTKSNLFTALSKLTFTQIQALARKGTCLSKIVISPQAFEKFVLNPQMTIEERRCTLLVG
ncbi:hypothetical protein V8Z74_14995 [Comamonas sp. w2-DMI]|uniref:hypothetical protein n=1 Tax=Comamonas sp. w2-DMI TaxID=3126391 RepID=UPI0032E3BFD1